MSVLSLEIPNKNTSIDDETRFFNHLKVRKRRELYLTAACAAAGICVLGVDSTGLLTIFKNALGGFSPETLTHPTGPVNAHSGILNGILGSFYTGVIGSVIGTTIGFASAFWRTFHGNRWGNYFDVSSSSLLSLPTIIYGVLISYYLVIPMGGTSAAVGGIALGAVAAPIVYQYTMNAVRLVPRHYWEAAYCMGLSNWQTARHVAWPILRNALIAGALLAAGRILGEAAPLTLTAGFSQFVEPYILSDTLTLQTIISTYGKNGLQVAGKLAWEAAGTMSAVTLGMLVAARYLTSQPNQRPKRASAFLHTGTAALARIRPRRRRSNLTPGL